MTFNEKFNLDKNMSHTEKYTTIVNNLGFEDVKRHIPFCYDEIIETLKTDRHLNELPLQDWSTAAGYTVYTDRRTKQQTVKLLPAIYNKYTHNTLAALCMAKGVTCFSLSELVCILKRCAIMWIEKTNDMENDNVT